MVLIKSGKGIVMVKHDHDHVVKATVVDGAKMDAWSSEMAERLANNEAFAAIVNVASDAAEVARMGCIPMYELLTTTFSAEELESFPIPGTEDTAGHNNPDKYHVRDPNNLTAKGEPKSLARSFWNDLFDKTPVGKEVLFNYSSYKQADANMEGANPEYIGLPKDTRNAQIKRWGNRQTYGRKLLKDAFNLWSQLAAVETLLGEHVLARIVREPDGTVIQAARCIGVINRKDTTVATSMSVANFVSLDAEKALVNGQADGRYYEALLSTIKKGTNGSTTSADSKTVKVIGNTSDAEGYLAELAAWFGSDDRDAVNRRCNQLIKSMVEDGNDELVLSFGKLFRTMEGIFTSREIDVRYEELLTAARKAKKAAA